MEEPSGRLGMEVLVGGLGVSARSSGTVKFEIREASGDVPICMYVRESHGNRRETTVCSDSHSVVFR